MPWLRRTAELVQVVENDPGATVSGTCAYCLSMNGRPWDEFQKHPHCACQPRWEQRSTQPSEVLDEEFVGIQPAEQEQPDEGGVEVFSL